MVEKVRYEIGPVDIHTFELTSEERKAAQTFARARNRADSGTEQERETGQKAFYERYCPTRVGVDIAGGEATRCISTLTSGDYLVTRLSPTSDHHVLVPRFGLTFDHTVQIIGKGDALFEIANADLVCDDLGVIREKHHDYTVLSPAVLQREGDRWEVRKKGMLHLGERLPVEDQEIAIEEVFSSVKESKPVVQTPTHIQSPEERAEERKRVIAILRNFYQDQQASTTIQKEMREKIAYIEQILRHNVQKGNIQKAVKKAMHAQAISASVEFIGDADSVGHQLYVMGLVLQVKKHGKTERFFLENISLSRDYLMPRIKKEKDRYKQTQLMEKNKKFIEANERIFELRDTLLSTREATARDLIAFAFPDWQTAEIRHILSKRDKKLRTIEDLYNMNDTVYAQKRVGKKQKEVELIFFFDEDRRFSEPIAQLKMKYGITAEELQISPVQTREK